jgi:hypothetical protein
LAKGSNGVNLVDLVTEIETGPLASELAPLWQTVFEAPRSAKPVELETMTKEEKEDVRAKASVHDVKTKRAGRLTPDAYYAIYSALLPRATELGWVGFTAKHVKQAKISTLK